MKNKLITLLLIAFVCLFNLSAFAQKRTLQGKVVDATTGQSLEGVSIKVKNANTGTISSADGSFQIPIEDGQVLEISYVGYALQTASTAGLTTLTIRLAGSSTELEQVVVVGNRGFARSATESAVPVDVVNVNSAKQTTAKPDLMSQLNMSIP